MPTQTAGIDVAPSDIDLSATENQLFSAIGREHALREALAVWADDQYDFIIIDCPPTLGLLTINALVAADSVIIPVQTQYYALKGFTALNNVINQIRTKGLNPRLRILGLLPTFYDARTLLGRDMLAELRELGDHHVFETMVKQTVRLGEAPLVGRPVTSYATQFGGRPRLPRAGAGGDRTWLDQISAARPRSACPRSARSSRPPSSACSARRHRQPVDRHPQRPASTASTPTPNQPRLTFDEDALPELAASITRARRAPADPRPAAGSTAATSSSPASGAGARREIAGLREIPAIIEEIDDETALEIAIIENLQREDLSPLDEALMYERMTTEHGYSLRKLAQKLGKDKGYIENRLRLADAPTEIKQLVSLRKDTLSHAYELLKVEDPRKRRRLAEQVASGELSLVKLRERIEGKPAARACRRPRRVGAGRRDRRRSRSTAAAGSPLAPRSGEDALQLAKDDWPRRSMTCRVALRGQDALRGATDRIARTSPST